MNILRHNSTCPQHRSHSWPKVFHIHTYAWAFEIRIGPLLSRLMEKFRYFESILAWFGYHLLLSGVVTQSV